MEETGLQPQQPDAPASGDAAGAFGPARANAHVAGAAGLASAGQAASAPAAHTGLWARLQSMFVPHTAVGLNIADDAVSVVKVHRRGNDFKVLCAAGAAIKPTKAGASPGARRAALVAAVREALDAAGIRTRKVVVNLPGDVAECNVDTYPPMPMHELEAVLKRQGIKLYGESTTWDYVTLPGNTGGERNVISVYAPGEQTIECIKLLKDCSLTASTISVSDLALLSLAQRMVKEGESAALVHFTRRAVSVTVIANGEPSLIRRIQLDREAGGNPEYVVQEINRTFLYFKQKCRGRSVARVIQSGASERMIDLLVQTTNVSVDDFSSLPFSVGAVRPDFSPVAAGLAVMGTSSTQINLLPDDLKEKRERGMKAASILAACISTVVIYLACYYSLHVAQRMYRDASNKLRMQAAFFEPLRREHEGIKTLREKVDLRRNLHTELAQMSLPWPYVLWGIGKIIPPNVNLAEMTLFRDENDDEGNWKLRIAGDLTVRAERRALVLRQLLDRLGQSGLFEAIQLDPLQETDTGAMGFSIRCNVVPTKDWAS
ncbi:MAG: hypothetical protein HQ592_16155 [Planctomycetes bacterium]|nr:hypothetical protein [Planctomycetota bacterium]